MLRESIIEEWREQLRSPSGSLTTNAPMPEQLINKLLEEDISFKDKLSFEEMAFPTLSGVLNEITGLNIIAGLQRQSKKDYLTLFRAIRFPTYKRMYESIGKSGYATSNYEQERILELYGRDDYQKERSAITSNPIFWTQPQERVVDGLPLFSLVNDALQIHYSFRGKQDFVALAGLHIPKGLIESGAIKLISNSAIDLDYKNGEQDFEIKDFVATDASYKFDYPALRAQGIDLHEIYSRGLPFNLSVAQSMGIEQETFLLETYRLPAGELEKLRTNSKMLKENAYFLHGIFGDQNIFARQKANHLPTKCYKVSAR